MLAHKHMPKLAAALMALAVCLCLAAGLLSGGKETSGVSMAYEEKLFDTAAPLTIHITMEEDDWQAMLDNALSETYYACDVEIGGQTFYQVGIRPKGNTSLTSIANDPTTDRYSFKLEFDQYVDGQTCWGLDKLVLNNNYADTTSMKEALVYDMYHYLGADASLYNYAAIYVNGEYWGVYLALEAVEDSFLLRNYGAQSGALYKPEGMDMGRGHMGDDAAADSPSPPDRGAQLLGDMPDRPEDMPDMPEDMPENMPEGMPGDMPDMGDMPGMFSASGGADLNYTDDALDSYQTIWDGEVTNTKKADHRRVVTALAHIAAGEDLERYMDVDNLLKYMAVHTFSVNLDSLSGNMAHNYYLYESGGRLNLLPWDYNLAFGGFTGGADSTINSDIHDPFAGTDFFDTLLADETYRAQYEEYLRQLAEEYVQGGALEAFYTRTRAQIDALVETDPTAFYTYEEYDTAAELLPEVVHLRAQSVLSQLSGGKGVDASHIDLTPLGGMTTSDKGNGFGGGFDGGFGGGFDDGFGSFGSFGSFDEGFGDDPSGSPDSHMQPPTFEPAR